MIHLYLAQQNYLIGQYEQNTLKIIEAIRQARENGGDLIIFPELALCGYPPLDWLSWPAFIEKSQTCLLRIAQEAQGIAVIVGAPGPNPNPRGKPLYNYAYFLDQGQVKAKVAKTLLPDYDVFDEYRHFEPGEPAPLIPFRGYQLGLTICEDIWDQGPHPLYTPSPLSRLQELGADLVVNISASPFDYLQDARRQDLLEHQARTHGLDLVYLNTVGAQTDLLFDGGSRIISAQGKTLAQLPFFESALTPYTWEPAKDGNNWTEDPKSLPSSQPISKRVVHGEDLDPERGIEAIHDALIMGIRDYFSKMGFTRALVASSGGIDSALTQTLATEALGPKQVMALSMPSPYTSAASVEDARQLSASLGNPFEVLNIENLFSEFRHTLQPLFGQLPEDIAEENIQSRIRGTLAMAMANKFGYILLNTSNKSELATGYGTLYGDMAGGLSVIGDLYKLQVYALARYINRQRPIIPEAILTKPPTAELHPGQLDLDRLPAYEILDPLLYQYLERQQDPAALIGQGFDRDMVQKVLAMVHQSEYKRIQCCPILRVSSKAFGRGRQIPVVSSPPW